MKVHNKELNGVKMIAWNDSGVSWAIKSTDSDDYTRTEYYDQKKFSLKDALQLHSEIYSKF